MTNQEIIEIYDGGTTEVTILENPATLENDPTLQIIAGRMIQFMGTDLNPHNVQFKDYEVASTSAQDPKNPIDVPYYAYVWQHKKTGRSLVTQNSVKHGQMVPFNIVYDIGELSQKEVIEPV